MAAPDGHSPPTLGAGRMAQGYAWVPQKQGVKSRDLRFPLILTCLHILLEGPEKTSFLLGQALGVDITSSIQSHESMASSLIPIGRTQNCVWWVQLAEMISLELEWM